VDELQCALVGRAGVFNAIEPAQQLDQQLTPRTADFPATTLVAEIDVADRIGKLLFVNHLPSSILAGDLDAVPDAASIRFLRGLQSLGGLSVWYRDAWGAAPIRTIPATPSRCVTR
jgi:hypothetical protein